MFIYLITNTVNGKYYVGQTSDKPTARMCGHRAQARQGSPMRLHAAMRKHGVGAFQQEVLATAETQEQLDNLERLWIAVLDARNFEVGYNASPGGDSRSRESVAKAGVTMTGAGNPNFGKTWSSEVKQRMADGRKGKGKGSRPADVCKRIAATRRARIASGEIVFSESQKKRLRGLRVGTTNSQASNERRRVTLAGKYVGERSSMFGRTHSEETRAKMRASHAARREAHNG